MRANPVPRSEFLEQEITARLSRLDLEAKIRLLSGKDHWSTYPDESIGLRPLILSDGTVGIRGVRWTETDTSINIPSATAIAATFDPRVAISMGTVIGAEARRKGVDVVLGPVVNLQRTPFGGRHFEAFSEDPYLTAIMGASMVQGIQAEGPATTAKHFIANEAETDRINSNSVVPEHVLREAYLAPFEAIVKAGGLGVMSSYNRVNGTPAVESDLVTDVLEREWGFDGLVVSDWGAIRTVESTALGGTDLAMPGPRTAWADGLLDAVRQGRVPESVVDNKVLRLLRLAARVGALDGIAPLVDREALPTPPAAESPEIRGLLRDTGAKGMVLLRNQDQALPLTTAARKIAVVGPAAVAPRTNGGGSAAVIAPRTVAPLDALRGALPDALFHYSEGARPNTLVKTLSAANGSAPGGQGVALIEFLDRDGRALGSETRDRCDTLTYGMGYPDGVPEESVTAIRASTLLSVKAAGDYVFAAAGVGHAHVTIDGVTRFDDQLIPINADAVVGMSLPPQATMELSMTPGLPMEVVFTYTPAQRTVASLRLGFDSAAPDVDRLIAEAVDAARDADYAVIFVGTGPEDEAEGFDRSTLALPGRQDELVAAVAEISAKTIVVVNSGAPVLMPWRNQVDAILLTWFGGQEMGWAVADVLTGDAEPGGRLPVTFPSREEGLPSPQPQNGDVVYREGLNIGYRAGAASEPAYAFGHGLGYGKWSLSGLEARENDEGVTVSVRVGNRSDRSSREVVQVYLSRGQSDVERPGIWFAGAAVSELPAGGEETVFITLPRRLFEHWDSSSGSWSLEPGVFRVHAGTSSAELPLGTEVRLGS
ncbi:glycoside hydrolase family 3 C-terminal domain-containing protein [Paenarthrobacter nitroguajacolicus]|uniref:glycoside hydrolase family 3 C-terminal domain-containing protein n=1 Tax=Paenarthrobacter nitroguajacolicus TaxID=211146 RepID=UPI00248AFD2E|nr:glycoside hydrolase family 3 C-terminal domain-containing protein [Paenarthrobacter nitroguajacolicus]MDI2033794.1 Beta-hexosaminidase [Paenarthrobacter nitroguajacolicus]